MTELSSTATQAGAIKLNQTGAVADPEEGPWGPLTPPFEVNFRRLN